MRASLLALAAAVALAGPAGATSLLERPPADPFLAGNYFSDEQHPREAASSFFLGHDAELESLVWWGGYVTLGAPPSPDTSAFEIRLYADTGFGPEATPLVVAAATATVTPFPTSLPEFEFTAVLPAPIHLEAGTTYWIAIVDVDPTLPPFAWRRTSDASFSFSRDPGDPFWSSAPGVASMRLEGRFVPEPGTALLAMLGMTALGARRRAALRRSAARRASP